ncbi:MAG: carboxypeptidase regulatory-like domain-containing protein [Candidatus Kapabacteria bacterium]|jgi:TonB-dependent SusC/RagA subfamily outer membrane receptor|nr:carboxypeptidase regulatory-like domain-containing protein [Candidatus Kapabacteria bacterium]
MRNKILLVLALLVGSFGVVMAQNATVKGKVTDKKNGDGLQGARVTLTALSNPATKYGKIAGKNGEYEVKNVPAGKYSVEVSYVGYKTAAQSLTVDAGAASVDLNFQLILDVRGLDEVVVTGVASRTQKSVAEVAVSRVNASELTDKVGYTSAGQLLQGKVAGVTITPASGQVGGGLRFNVRAGAGLLGGSPTVFIDGVRVASGNVAGFGTGGQEVSALADLNPADIQDIEILKGPAATALYGPQGQNGIVLIKTKRGRGGEQDQITIGYQGIFGWNENHRNFTQNEIESWREANAIFRRGPVQQHGINLQGNSGIFNYYVGYENRAEQGFVIQNSLARQSVRLNLEAVTSKDFKISASANFVDNTIDRPQNDNNLNGWQFNTRGRSPFAPPAGAAGAMTLSTPNGFTDPVLGGRSVYGGIDSAAIAERENSFRTQRFTGSVDIRYAPSFLPGFSLSGVVGYDVRNSNNTIFAPANRIYPGVTRGLRGIFAFSAERLNFDLNAAYQYNLGESIKATTTVGGQAWNEFSRSVESQAQQFPTELIRDVGAGLATTRVVSEGLFNIRNAGWFVSQNFDINQTFFLTGAVRQDYASSYGVDAPSIFYPAASGAARLDKLGFLPEVINLAKVRVAYGENGRLPGFADGQALLWTAGTSPYGAGATRSIAGNTAIQPERTQELELGLEMEFDNAYGFEATYYISNSRQSLINLPRPPSTGLGNQPSNIASINGWGFESMFYARPIQTADYSLDLKFIFNYADNQVQSLGFEAGGPAFLSDSFNYGFLIPGQRRGQFMGLRPIQPRLQPNGYYDWLNQPRVGIEIDTTGVIRTPQGNVVGYSIGSSVPLYTGSFSLEFRFLRDFTIYALAEYAMGGYVYNGTRQFGAGVANFNDPTFNRLATQLGIFGAGVHPTNALAAQERGQGAQGLPGQAGALTVGRVPGVDVLTPGTEEYRRAAQAFLNLDPRVASLRVNNFAEPANWLRIREISLRWNATRLFNDLTGGNIKNLSFTATSNNFMLFTNYSGPEVEINAINGTTVAQQLNASQDFFTLMQARVYNFIVSVGF